MFSGLRLAVIVPAYNEADRIVPTVRGIPDYVDDIVIVDDASSDRTADAARAVSRTGLAIVCHAENRGVGAAIATGYRWALARGCDVAVVMAGDGQMDPTDLPALLAPIRAGIADYTKGNRFAHAEIWHVMPHARLLGNVILSLLSRPASGYWHLFDSQCGFTAASRHTLQSIDLDSIYPRYGYPNDLLARLSVAGLRVVDVPVRPVYGPDWRSGISLRTAIYPVLFVVARSLCWRLAMRARSMRPTADQWAAGVDFSQGDSSSSSVSSSDGSSRAPRV